jgi:hypothetical protein
MRLSLMSEICSAIVPKLSASLRDSDSGSVEGGTLKRKTVKARGEGVEYPALIGKVIRQVRFVNDEDYTALTIEFDDSTLVSFRFKASIAFSIDPELSTVKGGSIVRWKPLKTRPVMSRVAENDDAAQQ